MNITDENTKVYAAIDRTIQRSAEFQQWAKILLDKTSPYGIVFAEHKGSWRVRVDGVDATKGLTAPECFRLVLGELEKKLRGNA